MTDDRSLERAARSFIEPGPTRAPEAAIERALLLIDTTPQERDLRIPRRYFTMTTPARVAAAAAIGVIAVGGALFALGRPSGVGGPGPSSSPPGSTTPSSGPASSPSGRADYTGLKGWIVFEHFGQAPDGSTTEFDVNRRMIWLVKADGSGLHELAPGKPVQGKSSPDVSPDGKKVVFESWGPPYLIWEVDIEGGEPRLISTDCNGLDSGCAEGQPAYSPDGRRIAFVRSNDGRTTHAIAIRDLASGKVTTLASTSVADLEGIVAQPTWSADGTQLAYHRNTQRPGVDEVPTATKVVVVNADGSGLRELPLPDGEAKAGDPDWSPDGSRIVFSTFPIREGEGQAGGNAGIYTIRPDGSGLTRIAGGVAPVWAPDGTRIMFWGFRSWAMMDADGKNQGLINQAKLTWFGDALGYGYAAFLQPTP